MGDRMYVTVGMAEAGRGREAEGSDGKKRGKGRLRDEGKRSRDGREAEPKSIIPVKYKN